MQVGELKDRLRQLLARKRCTQKEIALVCGVSNQAVNGWLSGSKPKPGHIAIMSAYLGVSSDYLANGHVALARTLKIEALMAEIPTLTDEEINTLVIVAKQLNKPRS